MKIFEQRIVTCIDIRIDNKDSKLSLMANS